MHLYLHYRHIIIMTREIDAEGTRYYTILTFLKHLLQNINALVYAYLCLNTFFKYHLYQQLKDPFFFAIPNQ